MKRTVKSCYECKKIYMVFSNLVIGEYCKLCRNEIQKKGKVV